MLSGWFPLWGFFDANAGLLYRREPGAIPSTETIQTEQLSRRTTADPGVVTAFHWGGFHLVPSFTLHEAYYSEERENGTIANKALFRNAPEFSVDLIMPSLGAFFIRKRCSAIL